MKNPPTFPEWEGPKNPNLKVLEYDFVATFDVDETLIAWGTGMNNITIHHNGIDMQGRIMQKHVDRIKMHKFWGNGVVVWSKSGKSFAWAVVQALGVEEYVDIVMAKPSWYYDDKKCEDFMGEHRYLYPPVSDRKVEE